MEAISFGLGEKLSNLRVSSLKEICSPHCDGKRTQVDLYFEKSGSDSNMIVSSTIKEGTRNFLINKGKVSKKMCDIQFARL